MELNPEIQAKLDQVAKLPGAVRAGILLALVLLVAGTYYSMGYTASREKLDQLHAQEMDLQRKLSEVRSITANIDEFEEEISNLEIKLQPLDPESAVGKINAISPQSLAKTPIAASLAKIESDLRGALGSKTIVLVTDGKETCDGKPEDVIKKLRDKGIDITLNIVGFAIGDTELELSFLR